MNAQVNTLDAYGPLLNARELARIVGITVSQLHRNARAGKYDHLRVEPVTGPRCYSKHLIQRWLAGERIDQPARVFGRKRYSGEKVQTFLNGRK
jgi:hypothetical protein